MLPPGTGVSPVDSDVQPTGDTTTESRWRVAFVFVLMLVGLHLVAGPVVRLSEWSVREDINHALLEARAWHAGHLDLRQPDAFGRPMRLRDTALYDGRVYNVFPPLFTLLSYAAIALERLQDASGAQDFYPLWYAALVALPLPCIGFWAFRTITGRSEWAAVLTAAWLLGTPMLTMLEACRGGYSSGINHVLSNTGLLLIAGDLLGKRRIWPAAVGLLIAMWTRQLTVLYAPALFYAAVYYDTQQSKAPAKLGRRFFGDRTRRNVILVSATLLVGLGTIGVLNWAKFGNPLNSGYGYIYEGRDDAFAQRAQRYGRLFDPRFIPHNFHHLTFSPPTLRLARMRLVIDGDPDGTSIWLTSPLLVFGLLTMRAWWRDPVRRALMFCSCAVILGFLCYHNTGASQPGYFRFALDFAPIWMAVAAGHVVAGRRGWITLACLGWSALYFNTLLT